MGDLWNRYAKSYHVISSVSKAHLDKYDLIISIMKKYNSGTILDAGCGSCIWEKRILEEGFRGKIYCIDSSKKMLEIASKNLENYKNIKIESHNLNEPLNYRSNFFDCVLAINVFFWLKNKDLFLKEVARVIKSKGTLVIVNPKPEGDLSSFCKTHFSGKKPRVIIKETFYNLNKVNHLRKIVVMQKKIDRAHRKSTEGLYHDLMDLKKLLKDNGFNVKINKEIQSKQNWIIVAEKQK